MLVGALNITFEIAPIVTEDKALTIFTQVSSETTDDTQFLESAGELPLQIAFAI